MSKNFKIVLILMIAAISGYIFFLVFQKLNLADNDQAILKASEIDYAKEKCSQKILEGEYEYEYSCYADLAVELKNELLCEITSPPFEYVKWRCYQDVAKEKNDERICEKIDFSGYSNSCYEMIAEKKNDERICDYISESDSYYCYRKMAEKKNDEKICDYILRNDDGKDLCYRGMANMRNDEKMCGKISNNKNRDICYIYLATIKKNKDICRDFLSGESRDECYKDVSIEIRDASLCDKIIGLGDKEQCFSDLSLILNDKSICDKVENQSDNCKNYFSIDTSNWSIYKNKEFGFEFKVPPLFERNGCVIREISNHFFDFQRECFYLSFDTMSINPLWGEDRLGEFMGFHVCPISYCRELKGFCEAIKNDEIDFEGVEGEPLFKGYIAENDKYIILSQGGPSHGGFREGMGWGWERKEIGNLERLMISSVKFIDDLPEEDRKRWMEDKVNPKCDYDDDFEDEGLGYLNSGHKNNSYFL